ncbi:RagB/SusD family nutrient uptake outer membrane protein [Niastella caeni]|uniref:RagB/SusD family nutrient uptake outer membrane protein n=1 Tax=Niastella caeni TaxID=2569763 RepID=A0A4S8HPC8_9BACT|nr:RagB/SusD family nutrient uptake outer membrane protein [Niastella caeni]THU37227.1 RagB/SusD family nutrient uptake outer membrane protein [Niastella caeni]
MNILSKYKVIWLAVFVTTFVSCSKSFLELSPPTSVSPETALSTENDLLVATRGMYAGLRTGPSIGATSYAPDAFGRTIPVIGDVMADNGYQSSLNTNRYTLYNNYSFAVTDANALGLWTSLYSVILRANNIINAPIAASANVNQAKGEAYAVRALCYFTLVRYFARPYTDDPNKLGVPIITTYNADLKPERSKVADVYTLIVNDLNQAYTLMTIYTNSSQFSKYAAKGLQAKVYLTMGDMANAKTAALDVINNSGFNVVGAADNTAYWNNTSIRLDKMETLFEVSSDAVSNLSFDALAYLYSQAGNYGDFLVASDLYALFSANDVRRSLYPQGQRPAGTSVVFINKYTGLAGDRSDTKVLRMSEMYLIAAEASVATNETDARTYVNYITSRRNADPIASTGTALYEDIINERRKELAFEGDRYLDLQRLKRTVVRSTNYTVRNIAYTNYRRILPIPQTEVDANPNIKPQQNEGYQ